MSLSAQRWIPLFEETSLNGWEKTTFGGDGKITIRDGVLSLGAGTMLTGIRYTEPEKLPTIDYEIEMEARRVAGFDFFCGLTFPVGDLQTCATLIVGGWGGGVVGISSIDHLDASENNSTGYMRFEEGRWYTIRLRVRRERLEGWIDEKVVFDADISGKSISLRPGDIELCAPWGLATFQTTGEIREINLRRIESDQ
jgi:hypothetical protein